MDIVAESGLKWVHFPLKYNTMVWPLCIFDLHHLSWGWNSLPSTFFSPCFHKYQPIRSKFSVFNFLLWKHALIKMRKVVGSCWYIFHYIYIGFSVLTFSFLTYLVSTEWKDKHLVGHLSLSKHWNLANLLLMSALLKKYRILIIFLAFLNPEFNNCMIQLAILFMIKWWWITFQHLKKSDKKHWQLIRR